MSQTTKPQESGFSREDAIKIVNQAMVENGLKPLAVVQPEKPKEVLLEIVGIGYENENLLLVLHSPHSDIQPYQVIVRSVEKDFTVRNARDVKHTNHTKPVMVSVPKMPFDQELEITVKSENKPDYVATTKFTRQREEEQPEQPETPGNPPPLEIPAKNPPVDETHDITSPETPVKPGTRIVYPRMGINMTGYGYAPDREFSINPEWIDRMKLLVEQKAIDFARIHIAWQDWEPNIGEYTEVEMIQAFKKIRATGCVPAICVRPYRNDDVIVYEETAMDHTGERFNVGGYHTFAPGANTAQEHFRKSMVRLAQLVNMHAPETEFTSLGWGGTEEFFLPLNYSKDDGRNERHLSGVCIFSESDRRLFKDEYGYDLPVYDMGWFPDSIDRYYRDHPKVLDYITARMAKIQREFNGAFKQNAPNVPVFGFYADVPSKQSAWYGHRDLLAIFDGCDGIYSSDGGLWEKFMAADLQRGTWPNKLSAIEIDPEDAGRDGWAYDGQINPGLVKSIIDEAVRRGVTHIPLAMAYGPNQIRQIGPVLREAREKGIEVQDFTGQIPEIEYGSRLHSDANLFREAWEKLGGKEHPAPFRIVRHKSDQS